MRPAPTDGSGPTEPDGETSEKISRGERTISFFGRFVLVAIVGFGLLLGLGMSSPGTAPTAPLGRWFVREGGYDSMGYWPYLHLLFGIVGLVGIPMRKRAARRYVGGTLTLGVAVMMATMTHDLGPVTLGPFALGTALILSALVYDRP